MSALRARLGSSTVLVRRLFASSKYHSKIVICANPLPNNYNGS